jgi:hypothetical protein
MTALVSETLDVPARDFYRQALARLTAAGVPFLLGGAYAFAHYTGVDRTPAERVCRGTLLSPTEYRIDVDEWGYRDPRLPPSGDLTPEQIEHWTAGGLAGR